MAFHDYRIWSLPSVFYELQALSLRVCECSIQSSTNQNIYKVYFMSADRQSTTVYFPYSINLSADLSDTEQQDISNLLDLLPAHTVTTDHEANETQPVHVQRFVDGRGLACPMPLLKTKVALRDVTAGGSLYVVATDANSQADITAFCQQNQQTNAASQLRLIVSSMTDQPSADSLSAQRFDTIYHFIITKTDSN